MWATLNSNPHEFSIHTNCIQNVVTNELGEFEKQQVYIQDFRKVTPHFRGVYNIYEVNDETGWTWTH